MKKNLIFFLFFCFILNAHSEDTEWVDLGKSALGSWNIYVDKNSILKVDDMIFAAKTYQDFKVTQNGIDLYDSDGKRRYITELKYRSSRSVYLYDCQKKMIGLIETRYFSKDKPNQKDLVLKNEIKDPIWTKFIIEKKYYGYKYRSYAFF